MKDIKGVILSGGPDHMYDDSLPIARILANVQALLTQNVPILGICFGMQLVAHLFGGKVTKMKRVLQGEFEIKVGASSSQLFAGFQGPVFFRNHDIVSKMPPDFKAIAHLNGSRKVVAIENSKRQIYGVQFHPEDKESSHIIIKNFVDICLPTKAITSKSKKMKDFRPVLIEKLDVIRVIEKMNKNMFKVKAYQTVIDQLVNHKAPIYTADDLVAAAFKGVGPSIKKKMDEILETGTIAGVDTTVLEKMRVVEELTKVHGIGVVKAEELFAKGVRTIADLYNKTDELNDVQTLGLRYYEDIQQRIPRKEMDAHHKAIKRIMTMDFPEVKWEIAGSYRRGAPDSGDIDMIITQKKGSKGLLARVIESFKALDYLVADLAEGDKKYMGVCKLPRLPYKVHRRIDIMFTEPAKYPFAILYFTGSQKFNVAMRHVALTKGYTMNEHGIKATKITDKTTNIPIFEKEEDIFEFLGMKWVEPTAR